jgi:hypothetical protein
MHPFTALIAAEHLDELRREAASTRSASVARDSHAGPTSPSAWSRLVGRSARGLSTALDTVATRLDPVQPCDESPLAA